MQAILDGRSETSKLSIFRAPLSPASKRRQLASGPQPSGVTIPIPVTTTRLMSGLFGRGDRRLRAARRSNNQIRGSGLFHTRHRREKRASHPLWRSRTDWSARMSPASARSLVQLFAFFSRNFTASPTVRIVSAASSGISHPNSSSNAITSSTVSRLSAPRSSIKLADSVTLSGSTPRCSTTIFLTRSEMFSLIAFTLAFSHGRKPRDPSRRGFVVAEGGERALPEGSFDGPQLPGCPDQAEFGYHTSPTLQRTLTRS